MKIAVGADKGGLKIKNAIVDMLKTAGHQIEDFGTISEEEPVSHTAAATGVAKAIQEGRAERGVLCCGTGMGVAITANKFKGVYAGVVESVFAAQHCRYINQCNVLCLGGYILGEYMAKEIAQAFINAEFAPGFEAGRKKYLQEQVDIIAEIEMENLK